jgi:uncharacterized protein
MYEFEVFQDEAGEYRWRLIAPNGKSVATSGESYTRKWSARRAVRKIKIHV